MTRGDTAVATMRGMATALCPNCGTARTGSFRFCRSCGLDFDAAAPSAPASVPAVLAPASDVPSVEVPATEHDGGQGQPGGDVLVIQVRLLKLWAGALVGGLVGVMLAGAVVVPFFGDARLLLGLVVGIGLVIVSAWLGLRVGRSTAKR